MNSTVVTGNIVRDPELRSTASGNAVASFSVADNRRFTDATGERREATSYLDVVAWGDLGRHVAESLRQGDRVTVTGRLEQRSWENGQGERRSKVELNATDVAASLRFATLAVCKPERGAELSEDQGYDYDLGEDATTAARPEDRQASPGDAGVQAGAAARSPLSHPGQPASPPPRRPAAQSANGLAR
jgi:single-strand DNA-binding protein